MLAGGSTRYHRLPLLFPFTSMSTVGGAAAAARFLIVNGVPHTGADVPPVAAFLESTPGAYTTTRTHSDASLVLFWDRHMRRLADSVRILSGTGRRSGTSPAPPPRSFVQPMVEESLRAGLGLALPRKSEGEELAITALVGKEGIGGGGGGGSSDVCVHIGLYVPPVFGTGARVALAGRGRELAEAKYSEWVRIRKYLEILRPPLVTELLLSNDGDQILEGCVTNFFVVCHKADDAMAGQRQSDPGSSSFEVQTAPISDGVLPGIIRQLVIEICAAKGIPFREVAPSWSDRELWKEAFLTNSLRLLQHVEIIQAPGSWEQLQSGSWRQISWVEKRFGLPGEITAGIQRALLERASVGRHLVKEFI